MSGGFGLPRIDFSPLSDLGKTLGEAEQRRQAAEIMGQQLDALAVPQAAASPQGVPQRSLSALGQMPGMTPSPPTFVGVSGANPSADRKISGSNADFVNAMLPHALQVSQATGVDPRIIIAQSAIETGWGKSAPGNNYFGIKSHGQAGGNTLATTENVNGQNVQTRDIFRAFPSMADSVAGYGDFITKNPRYQGLRTAQGLEGQAQALQASGYATDPQYGAKVLAVAKGLPINPADMPAPNAVPISYQIPPGQPDFQPGTVASPAIGTGAAGSMPDAATGAPRVTPQQVQQLKAMLANPITAPQAQAIIQKLQAPQEWETKELGGRVVQVNKQGAVRPLPGFEKAPEFQTQKGSDGNDYTFNKATGQWTRAIAGKDTSRRDLTLEEKVQRGLDPKAFAQIDSDGQVYFPNKAGTEINLNQAAEKAQDVKIGGAYGDTFNEMQNAGRGASGQINTLRLMEKLIENPNFYSGTGSSAFLAAKRAAASLGVPGAADAAAPNELFAKLANQSVVDKLGGSLGSGVSNADVSFITRTTANAENTPEGNRRIIQFGKALAQRQIEVARLARQYAGSHGGRLDPGFDDQLAAYAEKNPLFPEATALEAGASQQPAPAQQGAPQQRAPAQPQPFQENATATNPTTGEKIVFRGGQWVPAGGAQPAPFPNNGRPGA